MLKTGKRLFLTLAIICGLLGLASCSFGTYRITLDSDNYELKVGETVEVVTNVTKDGVETDIELGYKSYDDSVVTFIDGKLTGLSEGTVKIKVYSISNPLCETVATVTVSFYQSLQAEFKYEHYMYKGDTQQITYTLALDSEDAVVSFKSSDDSILSVDENGKVLSLKLGNAEIIATVTSTIHEGEAREFRLPITVDSEKHSLTFDLNGGVCEELPDSYTEGIGVKLPTPTKNGYEFLGWLNDNKLITEVTADMEGSLKLVASWKTVQYNISLVLNDGAAINLPTSYTVEDEVSLPTPVKQNYNFIGWFDNAEFNGEALLKIAKGTTGDIKLYAKYDLITYSVELDLNGGFLEEDSITFMEFGQKFLNDFNSTANTKLTLDDFHKNSATAIKTVFSNETFYNNYKWLITFAIESLKEKNGNSTDTIYTETITFLEAMAKDFESCKAMVNNTVAPGPNGRTLFRRWLHSLINGKLSFTTDPAATYKPYCVDFSTSENQEKLLAAYFSQLATSKTLTVEKNSTLPTAFKYGSQFLGWFDGDTKVEKVTKDVKLVAKWKNAEYTISYDLDGGKWGTEVGTSKFEHDEQVTLVTPVKEGYKFLGWYSGDTKVEEIGNDNYQLTAKWEKDETVTPSPEPQKTILVVDPSKEDAYKTIADALAAAKSGDVISIVAGTYTENITISVDNLTIQGPNATVNPNKETRATEAVLKGTVTVDTSAHNLKLLGLAFTEGATIKGTTVNGFTFKNNYVYDTTETTNAWVESNTYPYGFIYFAATTTSQNLQFYNNKFDNVSECNITLSSTKNVSFEGNVFNNFDRDAIRFLGGYNDGVLSFTNNEFTQDKLSGYNGIYFRIYGGSSSSVTIVIENNKFINIGNAEAGLYSGAISARNYQEKGATITISGNYFKDCYNYIRIRNNASAANHKANLWSCNVENNQFIGLPTSYYFAVWNASDSDTSQNPSTATFGANYYEDNSGKVITDLASISKYFLQVATYGTAVTTKPTGTTSVPLEFYTIQYDLDGGTCDDTFVTIYSSLNKTDIELPTPKKSNYIFLGWNFDGKLVSSIPAETRKNLVLVAEYQEIEGEAYTIIFVDKDNLGTWPSRDAKDKAEILSLLWADMYEWAKSNGETKSYDAWYEALKAKIDAGSSINLRNKAMGPYADENGSTEYFVNSAGYYDKWIEFFKLYHDAQISVNSAQPFFATSSTTQGDDYSSYIRWKEFVNGTRAALDKYLPEMLKAVRVTEEIVSEYRTGQVITLPVLTNKLGLKFYGWYDNPEFTGDPITKISSTDSGNKTFYAKWEEETKATAVTVNAPEKIKRFDTYQLVWSFTPENTTYKYVEFFSSDTSIATVSLTTGLITTYKEGEVTITMRVYGNRELDKTFHITVYSPERLNGSYDSNSYVTKNETIKLLANDPHNKDAVITWSSSDADIAYVDATSGVVTGVKEGNVTITASTKNAQGETLTLDFIVTVLDKEASDALELVLDSHNSNVFTRYELSIGGSYNSDIYGSVSKLLYNHKLTIDTKYYDQATAKGNYNKNQIKEEGLEFITVHYTAGFPSTSDTDNNASYFSNSSNSSIHFVTGNKGTYSDGTPSSEVYQNLSYDHGAWHAGDSGSATYSNSTKTNSSGSKVFTWMDTGVKAPEGTTADDLLNIVWSAKLVSGKFCFVINGQATDISLPSTYNYNSRNTDHVYNSDGTVTSQSDYTGTKFSNRTIESFFNDQGFPVTIGENGNYYMGPTWWCYTQVHEGRICGTGGNRNSIGIESCVNLGSDLWYTWQVTAKLVAQLMLENDLDISRVKGHHFFSGKDCPQPLLENDLEIWWEFIDLVKAEYELLTEYSKYEFTFTTKDSNIISENGRVQNIPELTTCITYTVQIKDASGNTQSITLGSMVQGIFEK